MRGLALGEGEGGVEVGAEVGDSSDGLEEGSIDGLLVGNTGLSGAGRDGLGAIEEGLLIGGLLGGLLALEVGIVDGGGNGDTGDVNLGGGGNDVGLVDTTKGDTVDAVGTGDKEETGLKGLEEDNALTTEATGQEDEDGARGDGRADLGRARSLTVTQGTGHVLGRVPAGSLVHGDGTLLAVLLTLDSDGTGLRGIVGSRGSGSLLVPLVKGTLGVHLGTGEARHTRGDLGVTGGVSLDGHVGLFVC